MLELQTLSNPNLFTISNPTKNAELQTSQHIMIWFQIWAFFVGVWKGSKFSFGEGIWVWRCLMFNLQNSKQFEIPNIWVRPNTIKLGSSNFIQYNIYYYYLFYIHIILRSTTLALSGKNRLKFRSKKCSCDELTRKITLIVFDYTHDELEPKPYKFKTSSKQKKALYYVSKYLL